MDAATAMNPGADGDKNPKLDIFKALIDTGATSTCISGRVVSATGLAPSGKTPMTGATSSAEDRSLCLSTVTSF